MRALACIVFLCGAGLGAQAQQTLGRGEAPSGANRLWFTVSTSPESVHTQGAYVGGQMVMDIRFESYDPFTRLRLALPQIEGARTETLVRPHTLQINMFGGKGYSHAARLAIIAQRPGVLVIPPIAVSGISQSRSGQSFEFNETHPQQLITVHPPSAEFSGDTWVVSHEVAMEEHWSPGIDEIRVGETVRRRVVLSVAGVTAEDLPELTLNSNTGYRVLNSEVSAETQMTENGFVAHLEQTWNIYIETTDVIDVDAVQFPYWNPLRATTEVVSAPRQRVEPLLRDAALQREQLRDGALAGHRAKRWGLFALLSLPLVIIAVLVALVIYRALPSKADLTLWRASTRASTRLDFYTAFLAWGRETVGAKTPIDHEQVRALGMPAERQVLHMERALFAKRGDDFDPRRIALRLIWAARRMNVKALFREIAPFVSRLLFLR